MHVFQSPGLGYTLGISLAFHVLAVLITGTRASGRLSEPPTELMDRWAGGGADTLPLDEVGIEVVASEGVATAPPPLPPLPLQAPARELSKPASLKDPQHRQPPRRAESPRVKAARVKAPRVKAAPAESSRTLPSTEPSPNLAPKATGEPSARGGTLAAAEPAGSPALAPGGSDLPPGVRPLGTAFTRALPYGSRLDAFWHTARPGAMGPARVEISTAADGALLEFRILERERLPVALVRMLTRAHSLLERGHFALRTTVEAGSLVLEIDVSVSDGTPSPDELARPADVTELGFKAPEKGRPGRAHFALASGRRVDATVRYTDLPE